VSYNEAVQYCRWLTEQEGLGEEDQCYPEHWSYSPVVPYEDYLFRRGYRLPTEEEWEYACRAGTRTCRFYGHDPGLMQEYAWYRYNAFGGAKPVGTLKPNDFGFFDMYGNVSEWCQSPYGHRLDFEKHFTVRGGSWYLSEQELRSAARRSQLYMVTLSNIGFRIARTILPPGAVFRKERQYERTTRRDQTGRRH
jgi:formylglycine-generating enzyme required for sulfatase activity